MDNRRKLLLALTGASAIAIWAKLVVRGTERSI